MHQPPPQSTPPYPDDTVGEHVSLHAEVELGHGKDGLQLAELRGVDLVEERRVPVYILLLLVAESTHLVVLGHLMVYLATHTSSIQGMFSFFLFFYI